MAVALVSLAINVRYYEDPVERLLALGVGIFIVVLNDAGTGTAVAGGDDDHHDSTHGGHGGGGDGGAHGDDGAISPKVSTVDYVEVGRTSHQLTVDHGRSAYLYADKLMLEAKAGGKVDEAAFWKAVSTALTPR